jgi:hypothetical protein
MTKCLPTGRATSSTVQANLSICLGSLDVTKRWEEKPESQRNFETCLTRRVLHWYRKCSTGHCGTFWIGDISGAEQQSVAWGREEESLMPPSSWTEVLRDTELVDYAWFLFSLETFLRTLASGLQWIKKSSCYFQHTWLMLRPEF